MQACIILTTTNNKETADNIARELVEKDLAKCVQIDDIKSCYKWEGKLATDDEFRLMIKARSSNYELIEQAILGLHNYKVPQILKIDIADGLNSYLKWLND